MARRSPSEILVLPGCRQDAAVAAAGAPGRASSRSARYVVGPRHKIGASPAQWSHRSGQPQPTQWLHRSLRHCCSVQPRPLRGPACLLSTADPRTAFIVRASQNASNKAALAPNKAAIQICVVPQLKCSTLR